MNYYYFSFFYIVQCNNVKQNFVMMNHIMKDRFSNKLRLTSTCNIQQTIYLNLSLGFKILFVVIIHMQIDGDIT